MGQVQTKPMDPIAVCEVAADWLAERELHWHAARVREGVTLALHWAANRIAGEDPLLSERVTQARAQLDPNYLTLLDAIQEMHESYIETALWSSTDQDGEPLDTYELLDVHEGTRDKVIADIWDFLHRCEAAEIPILDLDCEPVRKWGKGAIGHDLWLTRNGHGVGFWDRDWAGYEEKLSDIARAMNGRDWYVGDDGIIYESGTEGLSPGGRPDATDPGGRPGSSAAGPDAGGSGPENGRPEVLAGPAPIVTYTITYDVVTPESAAEGDYAESGFYMPGGWYYPIPDGLIGNAFATWRDEQGFTMTIDPRDGENDDGIDPIVMACYRIIEEYSLFEPSSPGSYRSIDAHDTDYATGADTFLAVHFRSLPDPLERALSALVGARWRR